MDFINRTPFAAASFIALDRYGRETLLMVVKGSWRIHQGALRIAEEQDPIVIEPAYSGAAGSSSLIEDTDLHLEKPGTDCALLGHAWALKPGAASTEVRFAVGVVQKRVMVFGKRFWIRRMGQLYPSAPAPFDRIPLVYERAFGGSDTTSPEAKCHEYFLENPVGCGFMARKTELRIENLSIPNLEDPRHLIKRPTDRPPPAGLGMIPPTWQPRAGYSGTHDERWRRSLCPLPPVDLDLRFYSCASPGLAAAAFLTGREQVLVEGASTQGRLLFDLPGVVPRATVRRRKGGEGPLLRLDTVVVKPDENAVVLTWRGSVPVQSKIHELLDASIDI